MERRAPPPSDYSLDRECLKLMGSIVDLHRNDPVEIWTVLIRIVKCCRFFSSALNRAIEKKTEDVDEYINLILLCTVLFRFTHKGDLSDVQQSVASLLEKAYDIVLNVRDEVDVQPQISIAVKKMVRFGGHDLARVQELFAASIEKAHKDEQLCRK